MTAAGAGGFAEHLRRLRQAAALSQEELAERASLTAKAVGALERGERRRPYPATVRALADALQLDEPERRALAQAAQGGPGPARPTPEAVAGRSSVPTPPTPLVGRDREVAEVGALLRSGRVRLVTLTGPGGVGKSRLAWEVAAAMHGEDAAPVAVAELASVTSADLALPTVARAIGLQAATDDLISAVAAFLEDREQLLVLDNLEHLLGVAPDIADLLSRCPGLVILATSRARLRVRAEQEYPLEPLGLPQAAGVATIASSAAVRLFADRARAVVPGFAVDHRNAADVAAICRRLDGLPLAIELVASHVRYLSPSQLVTRLDEALDAPRLRDLPARQRTMRTTLDWSCQLLTDAERTMLRALSVFRGGFGLDDVEEVLGDGINVLTTLDGLVEQSLVTTAGAVDSGAPVRYRLLEPVRLYADALLDRGEATDLAARHARHHGAIGRDARVGLHGPDQGAWLDRLEGMHANLRQALHTLIESDELAAAARLAGDIWLYWALRGHAGEGLRWCQQVLDRADEDGLDRHSRAGVGTALAGLRLATGDIGAVLTLGEAAVADARATDDLALLADALVLWCTGTVFAGDLAEAESGIVELLTLARTLRDPWVEAHGHAVEAQLLLLRGEPDTSTTALDQAEDAARAAELPFTLAFVLNMRATLALHADDDMAALEYLTESVRLATEVGTTWTLVYSLHALAGVAARHQSPALAATLFSAGAATAEATLLTVSFSPEVDDAAQHLAAVRRQLSADEFHRAWEHGRTLRAEQLLDLLPEVSARFGPG